ncbi:MAG: hypothetical protein FWD70_05385 [Desulfuromonadales bacterium]|nr:hypothetical protein [Desulfuromonadales bacterium]
MQRVIAILTGIMLLLLTTIAYAGQIGIGYIVKADNTKLYEDSEGTDVEDTVKAGFPLLAYESGAVWFYTTAVASESLKDGRAHVQYFKNGKDGKDGLEDAWVDPNDVTSFPFDCCGDKHCTGIKALLFKTRTYSDCFNQALKTALNPNTAPNTNTASANNAGEIEKLKLQLEIEKIKLEQERLKSGSKNDSSIPRTENGSSLEGSK